MTRVVLPVRSIGPRRRWRRSRSKVARVAGEAERHAPGHDDGRCALCGASIMSDGTGHDAECWGLA